MESKWAIDYVVPMVFPEDAAWQKDWERTFGKHLDVIESSARWRSWGTEELLIRAVMKNMPWLRTIYILLARESQVQEWMREMVATHSQQTGPEVRLVYHREFIPAQFLPTFNVNTLEMFLHRIPGLSEYFLYGNDDIFPLSRLAEDDFFRTTTVCDDWDGDGVERILPCQHHNVKDYPSAPNIFHRFCMGGLNMVAADFGQKFSKKWLRGGHSIAPILKSTCEEVWRRHGDRINHSFTNARSEINFNQYIYSYWQHLSGRYVDHVPQRQYVNVKEDVNRLKSIITGKNPGIVCINDNEAGRNWRDVAKAVRDALRQKIEDPEVVVTMTSFPARINFVPEVLESIYRQTRKPDRVVLHLSRDEFDSGWLMQDGAWLMDDDRLTVRWHDGNERAFKKLIYTLREWPDAVVVSIDDDIIYPEYFVETIFGEIRSNGYTAPVTCGHVPWKSWGGINSHYGGFTATMSKFYRPYLDELYDSFVKPLALTGEARFDDELYTLTALVNGVRYQPSKMNLNPLRKEHILPGTLSVHGTEEYRVAWRLWRELLREAITARYGIDPKPA